MVEGAILNGLVWLVPLTFAISLFIRIIYAKAYLVYIVFYIYTCLMFGLIQSSGTNLYLPCYLQQTSHDSKSITPLQQQGALSHINIDSLLYSA